MATDGGGTKRELTTALKTVHPLAVKRRTVGVLLVVGLVSVAGSLDEFFDPERQHRTT